MPLATPTPSIQYAWDGPGALGAGQSGLALVWNNATGTFEATGELSAQATGLVAPHRHVALDIIGDRPHLYSDVLFMEVFG